MARPPLSETRGQRLLITADAVGGVWTYVADLLSGLVAEGWQIAVAVMGPAPSPVQAAQLARWSQVTLFHKPFALEWMPAPWADVDAAGAWLLEVAAVFRADLVHLNGYAHAALPWTVPVVVVAHSDVLTWWRAVKGEAAPAEWAEYRRRVARGLAAADLVIAPTAALLAALEREYGELPAARDFEWTRPTRP